MESKERQRVGTGGKLSSLLFSSPSLSLPLSSLATASSHVSSSSSETSRISSPLFTSRFSQPSSPPFSPPLSKFSSAFSLSSSSVTSSASSSRPPSSPSCSQRVPPSVTQRIKEASVRKKETSLPKSSIDHLRKEASVSKNDASFTETSIDRLVKEALGSKQKASLPKTSIDCFLKKASVSKTEASLPKISTDRFLEVSTVGKMETSLPKAKTDRELKETSVRPKLPKTCVGRLLEESSVGKQESYLPTQSIYCGLSQDDESHDTLEAASYTLLHDVESMVDDPKLRTSALKRHSEAKPMKHTSTVVKPLKHKSTEAKQVKHMSTEAKTVKHTSTEVKPLKHMSTEARTVKHTSTEAKPVKHTSTEVKPLKRMSIEAKTVKHMSTEVKPLKHKSTEAKPVMHMSTEAKTVKHTSTEVKPLKHMSTEARTVKHMSTEAKTMKHRSTEAKPVKHRSTEVKPVKHKSTEAKTVKHRSTEANTVMHKSTEAIPFKAVSALRVPLKQNSTEPRAVMQSSPEAKPPKQNNPEAKPLKEDCVYKATEDWLGEMSTLHSTEAILDRTRSVSLSTNLERDDFEVQRTCSLNICKFNTSEVDDCRQENSARIYLGSNSDSKKEGESYTIFRRCKRKVSDSSEEDSSSNDESSGFSSEKEITIQQNGIECKANEDNGTLQSDSFTQSLQESNIQAFSVPLTDAKGGNNLTGGALSEISNGKYTSCSRVEMETLLSLKSSSVSKPSRDGLKSSLLNNNNNNVFDQNRIIKEHESLGEISTLEEQKNSDNEPSPISRVNQQHNQSTVVYAMLIEVAEVTEAAQDIIAGCLVEVHGVTEIGPAVASDVVSLIVVVYCRSKEVAELVTRTLSKENGKPGSKIWCFYSFEKAKAAGARLAEENEISFKMHLQAITRSAEQVVGKHCDKIVDIQDQIKAKETQKKNKYMFVEQYMDNQVSIDTLHDKEKEMNLQKAEFYKYLRKCTQDLRGARAFLNFERAAQRIRREFTTECNRLTNALPIYGRRSDILTTVKTNQVCVVIGETGSGKSTQMAQYFYQAGLARNGMIACTQPRKIAATSLATQVAKEMKTRVGDLVGYKVGMQMRQSHATRLLYMTDHMLLNECLKDRKLSAYSCIIIDEAHERSIYTDLLLGMIKECLQERKELRAVITSATISPDVFVKYFNTCPVLQVSGRTFPVDVVWERKVCGQDSFDNYQDKAVKKAIEIHQSQNEGDILVFLTKPVETERCSENLIQMMSGKPNNFVALQLHGRLQWQEQQKVFDPPPPGVRKIVFATNCAETSVTIPGIKYVIDTGLVNEMKFDPVRKISTLAVTMVTQSSARQRRGRAGRLGPGKCFCLYTEEDFRKMTANALPEILKVHIGHAMLKLMELGVNPLKFDFIEPPSSDALKEAFTSLIHIGAVVDSQITVLGKWVAKMPFDPQYGAFVYEALQEGLGVEALVVASASGSGPVFYRAGTNKEKELADKRKTHFCHSGGDQLTTLNVFREWHKVDENEKGKWCMEHYVNGKSVKAIRDTTKEVLSILKNELNVVIDFTFSEEQNVDDKLGILLFKALRRNLSHYLGHSNAGYYIVSKDQRVEVHPSSAMLALGMQPEWIVFDQVIRTSRDFAVQITPVPENRIEEGIKEGWLHLNIEEARKKRISVLCREFVGSQLFRKFVGPRYVDMRSFEAKLTASCPDSVVMVEADEDKGELRVLACESNKPKLANSILDIIQPLRNEYRLEESEETIGSATDFTARAVLGPGGSTQTILMPGEYKEVIICCPYDMREDTTETCVRTTFDLYGKIKQCTKFSLVNSTVWGKVVYEDQTSASAAVEATSEGRSLNARPSVSEKHKKTVNFKAKISWCRRTSTGSGYVQFAKRQHFLRAIKLKDFKIGDSSIVIKPADKASKTPEFENFLMHQKNTSRSVCIKGLNKSVIQDDLRESFSTKLNIDPVKDIKQVIVFRNKAKMKKTVTDDCRNKLQKKIEEFSHKDNFQLTVHDPRTERDTHFTGYCSFKNPEEGQAACSCIDNTFSLDHEVVSMKPDIQSSVLIKRDVYKKYKKEIEIHISKIDGDEMKIKHKVKRNKNVLLEIRTTSIDALRRALADIQKVMKGEVIECEDKPDLLTLFSREGQRTLYDIMKKTETLIVRDDRVLSITIHGEEGQRLNARTRIADFVQQQTSGVSCSVELRGGGRPSGVMKALLEEYRYDLSDLQSEAGLQTVKLNLRFQKLIMSGTQEAIDKANGIVNQVISRITADDAVVRHTDNPRCIFCSSVIEYRDLYRLEYCGHSYCRKCIQLQVNTAIKNRNFPIMCKDELCSAEFVWRDFSNLSRLGLLKMAQLVKASVRAYVSRHKHTIRYCITPDCPALYRLTHGRIFTCPECGTHIST